jgi:uncharacterized membrane protein
MRENRVRETWIHNSFSFGQCTHVRIDSRALLYYHQPAAKKQCSSRRSIGYHVREARNHTGVVVVGNIQCTNGARRGTVLQSRLVVCILLLLLRIHAIITFPLVMMMMMKRHRL